jgi:hypothetical protein
MAVVPSVRRGKIYFVLPCSDCSSNEIGLMAGLIEEKVKRASKKAL